MKFKNKKFFVSCNLHVKNFSFRSFSLNFLRIPSLRLDGVSNACDDGLHCLFLDYDSCNLNVVLKDYKKIQDKYRLPKGLLFSTFVEKEGEEVVGNFHVVCLKKFSFSRIIKILNECHVDPKFIEMPSRNRFKNWVLRFGVKGKRPIPLFINLIGHNFFNVELCSNSHRLFFDSYYDLKIPDGVYDSVDELCKHVVYSSWRE